MGIHRNIEIPLFQAYLNFNSTQTKSSFTSEDSEVNSVVVIRRENTNKKEKISYNIKLAMNNLPYIGIGLITLIWNKNLTIIIIQYIWKTNLIPVIIIKRGNSIILPKICVQWKILL